VDGKHEPAGVVDQRVIDAPEIDADRREGRAARKGGDRLAQAGERLVPKRAEIPNSRDPPSVWKEFGKRCTSVSAR
jgi:hypothetical protein